MSYCSSCPGNWGDPFPMCLKDMDNSDCPFEIDYKDL